MNTNEQINLILAELSLSGPKLAEAIGVNAERIKCYQRGQVKRISPEIAEKLCNKFPQFDKMWVMTGNGDPHTKYVEICHTEVSEVDLLKKLVQAVEDLTNEVRQLRAMQTQQPPFGYRMVSQDEQQFAKTLPSQKNIG